MALSIVVNGGGTFSASMEEGPVSFTATLGAVPGPKGDKGDTGATGVVAATAPITYDSGTQTVGIDTDPTFDSVTADTVNAGSVVFDDATSQTTAFVGKARTLYLTGVNKTGTTIAKGKAVYISGATGNKPELTLARADSEATSSKTIGITTAAIANNATGEVVVAGDATGLDTSAYSEGQGLYLSPTSAGDFVTSLPTQPYHGVFLGVVTRSNNSNGQIEVHIQNYQELRELSDVLISSPSNGQVLTYESASGLWKNVAVPATDLSAYLTSATAASTYLAKASNLSDLASASTARTNLGLGTAALSSTSDFAAAVHTHTASAITDFDTAADARVNALVPAASTTEAGKVELATEAEAVAASSSTLAITARTAKLAVMEDVWSPSATDLTAAQSGTGAGSGSSVSALSIGVISPNSATAGYATRGFPLWYSSTSAGTDFTYDGVQAIGCVVTNTVSGAWTATNNAVFRAILGRRRNTTIATPTYAVSEMSFGFEVEFKTGGPEVRVFAHNGTALSTSVASFTITNVRPFMALAVKDGGTVRLYINGIEVASTTGAPTGSAAGIGWAQWEIVAESTTTAGNMSIRVSNPKVIHPVV